MTLAVFLAVLGAALLHASWNAVLKQGSDKLTNMLVMTGTQGLLGLAIALSMDWPKSEAWPWLVASGILHAFYKIFLISAYEHGDLSRVYPIARGTAPALVLGFGVFLLSDDMTLFEVSGIVILVAGILTMAHGVFSSGESRRLLPFALGSALATAGYSIVDGLGARIAGDATLYVAWMFALDLIFLLPSSLIVFGRIKLPKTGRGWAPGMAAAIASYGAYWIVVWAMTQAPIALVTALRETSILFAVLIGWFFFHEKMGKGKIIAACLILTGVVLTRL